MLSVTRFIENWIILEQWLRHQVKLGVEAHIRGNRVGEGECAELTARITTWHSKGQSSNLQQIDDSKGGWKLILLTREKQCFPNEARSWRDQEFNDH